jgi:hypothetical protein
LDDWSAGRELGDEGEKIDLGNGCVIERFLAYYLELDGSRPWPALLIVLIHR